MDRTHYNNGDEIGLVHTGCDSCSPARINEMLCHETGCPDAWRDRTKSCRVCGYVFLPTARNQSTCDDCASAD